MADEDFFKEKYFTALMDRLNTMDKKIDSIQSRVNYMYGFAAAIGFFVSFAFEWVKMKFFPHN